MKAKNRITFLLLFIMSLYVTHGLFFADHYDEHEHHVTEYMQELQAPSSCDNVCDYHFVFHQLFILPHTAYLHNGIEINLSPTHKIKSYFYESIIKLYKPPIS
jgi:hypothetical protein